MKQGFEVLAVSADGPEVASLREQGIPHQAVEMTRVVSPLRDLLSLVRLIGIIRQFKPDIVHTHTPKAGLLGMVAGWICRVPVRLHTVAGLPLMERRGLMRLILVLTEKVTYACATCVYPNSKKLKAFIEEKISPDTSLKVIGNGSTNGIDTRFFSVTEELQEKGRALRRQYNIGDESIVFAFIGRVVRDKGVNELVEAFNRLSGRMDVYLFLAGTFEDDLDPVSSQTRMIIEHSGRIITLGYVADVRPVLVGADVFVFPSYREGFPNVVMQACCLETPCIVSDINGCNEIITHNETGLLVPPKDVRSLETAMALLTTRSDLRRAYSQRARAGLVANFDQTFVWQELLNEYKAQLARCLRPPL